MAVVEQSLSPAARAFSAARAIKLIGLTLALGFLIVLGGTFLKGDFLLDSGGQPIANDFVDVYAAGRLALDGEPAAAYDWPTHKQAEVRALGHDFADYYGWHYPPTFFFVAAALASLPFLAAALVSLLATLAAYVAAMAGILGRTGIFVALGFPAALWNVTAGQNGFLTAALIGGTLGLLERRPALAGVCLGLLTYKPQFGLLFPLVLIADRRWRTIAVAAAVAIVLAASSWLAFGGASWAAFVHWLPITSHEILGAGRADFGRLQSLFGFVRARGGSEQMAWTVQAIGSVAVAVGVIWLWRSRASYELKAAALAAGTLAVTPYVYMYDLAVLAVAVAYLLRYALERGFWAMYPDLTEGQT
jgi:arabinofuranan 3-O-arabinosyltransferase